MLSAAAQLGILEEAATAVLTLSEGLDEQEFFATRLTQQEVLRQLRIMAATADNLTQELKVTLAEIDWAGWSALGMQLNIAGGPDHDAIWFGVRSLVPAMLMWLRVYRQNQPEVFAFTC
jgi:uncharacterized protein with HEPN domain